MTTTEELLQRRYRVLGRGSPLFYDKPLHLVRGEGVWLFDADGRRYLDAYNNVPHVGHCHPRVVEAIARQAATLNTHTRYLHEGIIRYAERLTATFDPELSMAFLACTGSEANEIALRMATVCTGHRGVICTRFAYHGNTTAVAQISTVFPPPEGMAPHIRAVAAPDSYRDPRDAGGTLSPAAWLAGIEEACESLRASGHGVAAMLFDTIFSSEGLPDLTPAFLAKAAAIVRAAGGVYIADEVQPGFGRTGSHMWGYQRYGVVPDIVTLGKPMGNGHPVSGVVARAALANEFASRVMYFNTFGGNPVSCAAANAVLDVLEEERLQDNARVVGDHAMEGLRRLQAKHALIGDVRGQGLFFGAELVRDRGTREPADGGDEARRQFDARARRAHQPHRGSRQRAQDPAANAVLEGQRRPASLDARRRPSGALRRRRMTGFYESSPSEQGERVARLARAALAAWELKPAGLDLLKYRENAVFRVSLADGRRYALRVHRAGYHDDDELRSELQWMQALAADGFDVPEIVPSMRGALFERVSHPDVPETRQVDLFAWIAGQPLGSVEGGLEGDADTMVSTFRTIGTLAARLHNHAARWQPPPGFTRHAWDADGLVGEQPLWGRFWELAALSDAERALMVRARDRVRDDLSRLERSPRNYGLIHADFAPENLMVDGPRVRLIDFDDAGYGWHLFEIATSLYFHIGQPYFDADRARDRRGLPRRARADGSGRGITASLLHGAQLHLSRMGAHAARDRDRARAHADADRARIRRGKTLPRGDLM